MFVKALIVYEEVPESTKFYAVKVTHEEWAWMKLTHGNYLNAKIDGSEAEAACNKLCTWLENQPQLKPTEPVKVGNGEFDYVLHTGFIL